MVKEQIEEMAKDLCKLGISCEECTMLAHKTNQTREQYCKAFEYAKRAYNAGYRKQKEGEWIENPIDNYDGEPSGLYYVCSVCHTENGFEDTPFCPNCGAHMRGGENE